MQRDVMQIRNSQNFVEWCHVTLHRVASGEYDGVHLKNLYWILIFTSRDECTHVRTCNICTYVPTYIRGPSDKYLAYK